MRPALRLSLASLALAAPLAGACGSRTGLLGGAPAIADAGEAGVEAGDDAGMDAPVDTGLDAPVDTGIDVPEPVDVIFPDVSPIDLCPDAGSTLIYLITQESTLYSFYPPTLSFQAIGPITCASPTTTPFSMAVDRRGIGYSVFTDGTLNEIDMGTAACKPTTFVPGQLGFQTFGMGFVANTGDAGETLFVAESTVTLSPRPDSRGLGSIDTTALQLRFVAPFSPPIPGPELTGTGMGQLFGFYTNPVGTGSHIAQIDPVTGALLVDYPLMVGTPNDAWAFAYWGGMFWVFTSPGGQTTVTRFDPVARSETTATTLGATVVGAGVSTCAPQ